MNILYYALIALVIWGILAPKLLLWILGAGLVIGLIAGVDEYYK